MAATLKDHKKEMHRQELFRKFPRFESVKKRRKDSEISPLNSKKRGIIEVLGELFPTSLSEKRKKSKLEDILSSIPLIMPSANTKEVMTLAFEGAVTGIKNLYKESEDQIKPVILSTLVTNRGEPSLITREQLAEDFGFQVSKGSFRTARKHRLEFGPGIKRPRPTPPAMKTIPKEVASHIQEFWLRNSQPSSSKVVKLRQKKKQKTESQEVINVLYLLILDDSRTDCSQHI